MSTLMHPLAGTSKHTNVRVEADAWRRLAVAAWRKRLSRTALLNQMIATVVANSPEPTPQELAEGCPNPKKEIR